MEVLLVLVSLFAANAARSIPKTVYEPTKEQLELIFGDDTPPAVETPAAVPNEGVFRQQTDRPTQKETSVLCKSVIPATVDLSIHIQFKDCEQQGVASDGNVDKNIKTRVKPESAPPEVHTRLVEGGDTDDRMSITGDECPRGTVRFGDSCVMPD